MGSEAILGIDFGTSCTSAGVLRGDRVELVQDRGDTVVPSVVYAPQKGPFEVGRPALMRMLSDPSGVIRSVKRVLGVPAGSPLVRHFAAGIGFRIDTQNDQLVFKLRNGDCAPEQVAGMILARVRELAEVRFGGKIKKAVITASAAPPPHYREALVRAARIAHLEVLEVIPEPIAGALAVGLHSAPANRKLVVCDFGGGTFDVSAIVQAGLKFTPIATCADPLLGGDDLDEALAEGVAGLIVRKTGYDIHKDAVRWSELLFRCEGIKRVLSSRAEAPFVMKQAYVERGQSRDIDCLIDRAWACARWEPLLERVAATTAETMRRAGWRPEDVDAVAMIGGSALVPAFQHTISTMFPKGRTVLARDADVAVATGAVLLTERFAPVRSGSVPVLDESVDVAI